ncbi:glycosyltransferase family 2 protein [Vibrio alginolyticus]|nr:glycosyltransferase family 2 protein [Vibrio alginolyticus]
MFLSIIVPVYNVKDYLDECLTSLLVQSIKEEDINYEVLVINDGSSDGSELIAQNFCERYSNFHFFSQKNQGQAVARNFAIQCAKGDYIAFVDSDDYVSNDFVTSIYECCRVNKPDLLYFDRTLFFGDDSHEVIYPNFNGKLEEYPEMINMVNLSACNKVFLKDLLLSSEVKFPEGVIYEDFPFVIYSMLNAKKITKCERTLYYVRTRRPGSTTTNLSSKEMDLVTNLDAVRTYLKDYPLTIRNEYDIFYNKTIVGWGFKLARLKGYGPLNKVCWKYVEFDKGLSLKEKIGLYLLKLGFYKTLSLLLNVRKIIINN